MQPTWDLSGFEREGNDTHNIVKKEPRRQGEKTVWSEMRGAMRWEQIAQKAGGWLREQK